MICANESTETSSTLLNARFTHINHGNIFVLIGPEGGFSQEEKEAIRHKNNFLSVSLGKNILRAETAAIATVYHANLILSNPTKELVV